MSGHGRIGVVWGLAAAVVMLGTVAAGVTYAQQKAAPGDAPMMRQRGAMMWARGGAMRMGPMAGVRLGLRQLGLTDEQKQKVRAVVAGHKTDVQALSARAMPARRALADAIANGDEAAVRQSSADLAVVQTDQALLAARIRGEILKILTPDQQEKARSLRQQFEQRMDRRRR